MWLLVLTSFIPVSWITWPALRPAVPLGNQSSGKQWLNVCIEPKVKHCSSPNIDRSGNMKDKSQGKRTHLSPLRPCHPGCDTPWLIVPAFNLLSLSQVPQFAILKFGSPKSKRPVDSYFWNTCLLVLSLIRSKRELTCSFVRKKFRSNQKAVKL